MDYIFLSHWENWSHRPPARNHNCFITKLDSKTLLLYSLRHRTWTEPAGSQLEASSLLARVLSTGSFNVHYWRRKVIMNLTQLCTLWATKTINAIDMFSGAIVAEILWEQTHFFKNVFKSHSMRQNPYLTLLKKPGTWD